VQQVRPTAKRLARAALGGEGKKFKIDPQRLLYSLRWRHNGLPPDYQMVLNQDEPQQWVNAVNLTLPDALRRHAPEAIEWERPTAACVVAQLDAFEAAQEAPARRHRPVRHRAVHYYESNIRACDRRCAPLPAPERVQVRAPLARFRSCFFIGVGSLARLKVAGAWS
jgi:hypothetical protein